MSDGRWVVVGGSGFVGTAVSRRLCESGADVVIVDRRPPPSRLHHNVAWIEADLLCDDVRLPDGRVVLTCGNSEPQSPWPWTLVLDNAITMARLVPALAGREVVLVSSVEVYGSAAGPLTESTPPCLPWGREDVELWCATALARAGSGPCPPWRAADLCRSLAAADPTGRWVYALAKWAQESLISGAATKSLWMFRIGNAFGIGQGRFVAQVARSLMANRPASVGKDVLRSFVSIEDVAEAVTSNVPPGIYNVAGAPRLLSDMAELVRGATGSQAPIVPMVVEGETSCGTVDSAKYVAAGGRLSDLTGAVTEFVRALSRDEGPLFEPPLPVVVPSRPARPDEVATRQSAVLWSGALKAGQRWSQDLVQRLALQLGITDTGSVFATVSGTAALRIAVAALVGHARPGEMAVLPSYTFPATAEILVQFGYGLVFADVDPDSWTISPSHVERILSGRRIAVVVAVDTFGNPASYVKLRAVCEAYNVPLLADSAAAMGSTVEGRPIGSQADAHIFSMSFAKTLTAGGAGGVAVLPGTTALQRESGWLRSASLAELHAIAGLDQIEVFDQLVMRRRAIVSTYRRLLDGHPNLQLQRDEPGTEPCFAHFVIRVIGKDRQETARRLGSAGIGSKMYFPALHRTTHRRAVSAGELQVTDALHREALALPLSSEMTKRDAELVVAGLEIALAQSRRVNAIPQAISHPGGRPAALSMTPWPSGRRTQGAAVQDCAGQENTGCSDPRSGRQPPYGYEHAEERRQKLNGAV